MYTVDKARLRQPVVVTQIFSECLNLVTHPTRSSIRKDDIIHKMCGLCNMLCNENCLRFTRCVHGVYDEIRAVCVFPPVYSVVLSRKITVSYIYVHAVLISYVFPVF